MKQSPYILLALWAGFAIGALRAQPGEFAMPLAFQYMLDNPAAVGLDGQHHIMLGARQQWVDQVEAPQTFYLATSHPFISRGLGLGLTLAQDQAGLLRYTRAGLNAAVHFNPGQAHRFSVGASARFQHFGFGIPNVEDPYFSEENTASGINLGLGINYHYNMGKGAFFNLQAQSPLMAAALEVPGRASASPGDEPLLYNQVQELLLQANAKLPIGGNNFLTPSLGLRGQLAEGGGFKKSSVFDVGLGVSFLNDVLQARVGYRSAQASMVYGGVGIMLGKKHQAYLLYEPSGDLGAAGTFAADFVVGQILDPKPPTTVETPKKPRGQKSFCLMDADCLRLRWQDFNARNAFEVQVEKQSTGYTLVTIQFADNINVYQDYFAHAAYLQSVPLDQLLNSIRTMYREELYSSEHRIIQATLTADVQAGLYGDSYETFTGESMELRYWEPGMPLINSLLKKGDSLTEGQLAAVKIHYLADALRTRIPELQELSVRKEVNPNPGSPNIRTMRITLIIN